MIGNTLGRRIIEIEDTDSTNSYAARLLHAEVPEDGTVIMAHYQKSGRGQRSTVWESEAGKNLLVSYIVYPNFLSPPSQFLLNQAITLGVYDFIISQTSQPVAIKWPNDILAGHSKIAGILVENSIRNNRIIHSICGIGINVNQEKFATYNLPATSLSLLENKTFDLRLCLDKLSNCIDKWYSALQVGNDLKIRKAYSEALFLSGTEAVFESKGIRFTGVITGVLDDGRLEIRKGDGITSLFMNKEVRFIF